MSVQLLRDGATADLIETIATYTSFLTERVDDLDAMRLNQGIIKGLRLAIEIVDHRANNLHAEGAPWR